ncbi:MAG: FAD-binding oxidoreductase [Planctomycetes bacterium]|nr:FAD-binding oxidoreductase [Planctomycetota bacterium]
MRTDASERIVPLEPRDHLVVESEHELAEFLRDCDARGAACLPVGFASREGFGAPVDDSVRRVSLRQLSGVSRFAPDDLTCGVRVGTRWSDLLATIEAEGLTVESGPIHAAAHRSVGGVFAEAPPNPRGHDRGALRSQIIGLRAMDGKGAEFRSGGRVVKNVAGYDLCKLFVGSGGAYFAALELELRLVALPQAIACCRSKPMTRSDASALWLELRRTLPDTRSIDLVMKSEGSACVEFVVTGAPALVTARAKHDAFEVIADGKRAWHLAPEPLDAEPLVMRGRMRPSRIADFLKWMPLEARGRVHFQGAFSVGIDSNVPPGLETDVGFARVLRGPRGMLRTTLVDAAIETRLFGVFGTCFAPSRISFDTSTPPATTRASNHG